MIFSTFIRYVERIPTIKDLIKSLNDDIAFKLNCGFLYSDVVPSEASYSRLLTKLSESNILATEGICQKVFKMKITTNLRQYTAPARGSKAWKKIYNRRTAVERVNTYLKEFFQLNNVRYRTGKRAKVHFDIVTLVYNASKFAVNRINKNLNEQVA